MCKVFEVTHVLGGKWSIIIIDDIAHGNFESFNDFLRRVKKMTPRSLSLELKRLESAGLIKKNNNGLRLYSLTEKGREMHDIIISGIKKWNMKWHNTECNRNCNSDCTRCLECTEFMKPELQSPDTQVENNYLQARTGSRGQISPHWKSFSKNSSKEKLTPIQVNSSRSLRD